MKKTKNYKAVAEWALTGTIGMSSEALACKYLGLMPRYGYSHPYDCGDFHNCYRLMQAAPDLDIAIMRECSPTWGRLVEAWPALGAAFEAEQPGNRWPAFNRLIHSVIYPGKLYP